MVQTQLFMCVSQGAVCCDRLVSVTRQSSSLLVSPRSSTLVVPRIVIDAEQQRSSTQQQLPVRNPVVPLPSNTLAYYLQQATLQQGDNLRWSLDLRRACSHESRRMRDRYDCWSDSHCDHRTTLSTLALRAEFPSSLSISASFWVMHARPV